jgi:RimJ/RimL family protein N-acetyltransferase
MNLELVETERLRLERWSDAHADALVAINFEPAVQRFLGGGGPVPEEASRAMSRRLADHWEQFGVGLWAVVERESETVCGFAGLSHPLWFPSEAERTEVGWRLHPDVWGRGYATEAGREGLRAGFEALGLEQVVSYIGPENLPSIAVAERLVMTLERTEDHPVRPEPVHVYAIDRAAWAASA